MNLEMASRGSAYIRYRPGTVVGPQDEIGAEVLVDRDADGKVLGIEILDVKIEESVIAARQFATDEGLAFPHDLLGALRERIRAAEQARSDAKGL